MPLATILGSRQAQPTIAPIQIVQAQAGNLSRPQPRSFGLELGIQEQANK
jgi:hypothetical protein